MNNFNKIDVTADFNPFEKIGKDWTLVTSTNGENYNTMTASWGFAGVIWNKPCVTALIRPQRYTKEFLDKGEYFTLSFFPNELKPALSFCGSHSGRDCDKAKETGLTPIKLDNAYTFEQANLVLVCKKLYVQPMDKECFVDKSLVEQNYANGDFHIAYIGEIVSAYAKD